MPEINFCTIPLRDFSFISQTEVFPKSKLLIFLITLVSLTFILSGNFLWKHELEVNKVANKNLYAIKDFFIIDEKATNNLLKKTIQDIKPGLFKDEIISKQNSEDFNNLIESITELRTASKQTYYVDFKFLSKQDQDYIISLDYNEWETKLYNETISLSSYFIAKGIPKNKDIFTNYSEKIIKNNIPVKEKDLIKKIVGISLYEKLENNNLKSDHKDENLKKITNHINHLISSEKHKKSMLLPDNQLTILSEERKYFLINQTAHLMDLIEKNRIYSRFDNIAYGFLPEEITSRIQNLSDNDWKNIRSAALNAFNNIQNIGFTELEVDALKPNINKYLSDDLSNNEKELIYQLIKKTTKPNILVDSKELASLKEQAKNSIEPVKVKFAKGELIVKQGDIISEEQFKILHSSGLIDKEIDWSGILNVFLSVLASIIIFLFVTNIFQKDFIKSTNNLWFMSFSSIAITGLSYLSSITNPTFIPLCVLCALVSMFLNRKVALVVLFILSFLYYQFLIIDKITFITIIVSSLLCIYLFNKVTQRIFVLKFGFVLGISQIVTINFITILSDIILKNERLITEKIIIMDSIYWLISGIAFSMLILALTPLIEEAFGLLTYSRLTELGDFNQSLLAELEERAPGTFQHSLAVATLSEFAAKKLNLDSTFCRVGAYYHDVGKLMKPEYYVENQFDKVNPHDIIDNPVKSARIIISHSRAGVVIAKKHKLPLSIINFIVEHHGSSLVAYFYHKAKKRAVNDKDVDENLFRYYGPKPQSKETAITMLADASEAAARAIKDKSRLSVKNKVKDIITEKMNDGQLSESGLELEEIAIIVESFTTVIMDFYHNRIEYPSAKKN